MPKSTTVAEPRPHFQRHLGTRGMLTIIVQPAYEEAGERPRMVPPPSFREVVWHLGLMGCEGAVVTAEALGGRHILLLNTKVKTQFGS